jgi:hypothetical protein
MLDDKSLLKQWKPSYDAGYTMQASLAVASSVLGLLAAWLTSDWRWIVGAALAGRAGPSRWGAKRSRPQGAT